MVQKPNGKTAAVIGGGYSGLVGAIRLAEAGYAVTVLEHGPTVGGLAGDFHIEGAPMEKAYHHLFRTDRDIIALAKELGVGHKLEWHTGKTALFYNGVVHSFNGPLDLIRFTPLSFGNRVRTGLVALYLQLNKKWDRYRTVTAYEWMRKAVGQQATAVIWEPLLRGKFDKHFDKVAMAWLWARIHVRGNSKEKGELTEKLGYFAGGFETFTNALVKRAEELGVTIRTRSGIEKLDSDGRKVTLTVAGGSVEQFDSCMATIPSGAFARLIEGAAGASPEYLAKLRSIDYLGARLMVFSSDQDISPYYWHNINDVDLPFLVFINHTKLMGTAPYGGKNVYYIATYVGMDHELFTCSDEELEKVWFAGLRRVFPGFAAGAVREKHFFRFGNAQHIVTTDYASKIPAHRTPVPNVYLCNFSQIFPEDRGTNYAVRDGEAVARQLIADAAG
ncbi:MAG TPA: NAD(P)/FAD-dependent oxidoreductase [Naasia sp.]|jgi:protoporphyrinogen oxidase